MFGGATANGPLNDLIHTTLALADEDLSIAPSRRLFTDAVDTVTELAPRTQHSASCLTPAGELIVFSGGDRGSEPVNDQKVLISYGVC